MKVSRPAWKPWGLAALAVAALLVLALIIRPGARTGRPSSSAASMAAAASSPAGGAHAAPQRAANGTTASPQRMVERSASLTVRASHVQNVEQQIEKTTNAAGGFLASTRQSHDASGKLQVQMTLQVPSARFDAVLASIRKSGDVTAYSASGVDVTQQYNGLTLEIQTLKAEAAAYQRLFQKAASMSDMLSVQQALIRVQTQLQADQKEAAGISRQVQYASIDVSVLPQILGTGYGGGLGSAIAASWHAMQVALLGLVTVIGWLLPWAGAALVVAAPWWWWRRHRKPVPPPVG